MFGTSLEILITASISISKIDKEDFMSFWGAVSTFLALSTLIILAVAPAFVYFVSKRYKQSDKNSTYR